MRLKVIVLVLLISLSLSVFSWGETKSKPAKQPAAKEKVVTLDSGLKYIDLIVGKGKVAKKGNSVEVHYVGRLTDGSIFDSSRKHGKTFMFELGNRDVIQGWDIGVAGMKEGGKRKLIIPPALGYVAQGSPPVIPPNATLEFEIDLIKVR